MGEKRGGNFRIILAVAHIATIFAFPEFEDHAGLNLSCTNHFGDSINCHLDGENCSEYSLTFQNSNGSDKGNCSLQQCNVRRCCCSVEMLLVLGDAHTVTVWREGRSVESKQFDVGQSMKPVTPTIKSVKETNGNFEVLWDTNMKGIAKDSLTEQRVTYYKASDLKKDQQKSVVVKQITVNGLSYYKILGRDLEPNTTYMVSVSSISNWSRKMSDSSSEVEFKTPAASSDSLLLAVVISLSIIAILLSGAIYVCFVKLKSRWWDIVTKYPSPKLFIIPSAEQEVLRPSPTVISSVCVDPIISEDSKQWSKMSVLDSSGGSLQHSSGISTGSSDLSYANTGPPDIKASVQEALCKVFPNINSLEERNNNWGSFSTLGDPCGRTAKEMTLGSSGLTNKTYSILIPFEKNDPEVHMQTEMPCESSYHSNGSDVLDNHHQQVPVIPVPALQEFRFPSGGSSFVETDFSYQPCNPESGTFSEGSAFSSFSSGTNTTMSSGLGYTGCSSGDEVFRVAPKLNSSNEGPAIIDTNDCNSSVSAESQSHGLLVDSDYQPFQNLVGQPDVLLLKPTCPQPEEHLDRQKEDLLTKIPLIGPTDPSFTDPTQSSKTPFLPFLSAERSQSVIVDSDYQSV